MRRGWRERSRAHSTVEVAALVTVAFARFRFLGSLSTFHSQMLLCEDRPRITHATLPAEICTTIHSQRGLSGSGAQRWGVFSQRRCDTIERLSYNPSGSSANSLSPLWTYSLLRQKLLRPLLASGITNFVNFCRFCPFRQPTILSQDVTISGSVLCTEVHVRRS